MSKTELGTKLGDILGYVTNAKRILSNPNGINDKGTMLNKELNNATVILNELYAEYVKYDERK